MTSKTVSIRCFNDRPAHELGDRVPVAIDVIRATTTTVTAVSMGRPCYVAPTLQTALEIASQMPDALLAGELGGNMPNGFDLNNSPARLAGISDISRPLVLLSSTGTRLMHSIAKNRAAYAACFRNYSATIEQLVHDHNAVALIGAGTRDEFREEDQMCCAWIAGGLTKAGFQPEDELTQELIAYWRDQRPDAFLTSRSVEYLQRSGQLHDLEFILSHFDDVAAACRVTVDEATSFTVALPGVESVPT